MFSLGLLCVALYNSPHKSPLECNSSISTYKRLFQSSSTIPTVNNNFMSSRPLPKDLVAHVLPRLITRRPAQRLTAKEFQETEFFDNILVSTIRFIESFPEKTPNEKQSFLRGLNKVLPSFPKSVMEKKLLPALLEETKDKALLSLILGNVFKIIDLLPSGRRAFTDKVRPVLKEIFVTNNKNTEEKDAARDAGLMVVLDNISTIANNSPGKEFKDGMCSPQTSFSPLLRQELTHFRHVARCCCGHSGTDPFGSRCRSPKLTRGVTGLGLQHDQERAVPYYSSRFQQNNKSGHQSAGFASIRCSLWRLAGHCRQ